MARNVEIKARIPSVEALLPRARAIAGGGEPETFEQDDTFFACRDGRLKLRVSPDGHAELIAYRRPDDTGPKTSEYTIAPIRGADAVLLRTALESALGLRGRIVKRRLLLRAGRTRIHLDRVDGLGDFLELEVVLRDDDSEADGLATARALMVQLGIDAGQLVAGAYLDLATRPR